MLGWFLLVIGGVLVSNAIVFLNSPLKPSTQIALKASLEIAIFNGGKYLFCGCISLGLAGLLKCILNSSNRPHWILLYADKILYGYAILLTVETIRDILVNGYITSSIIDFVVRLIIILISGYTLKHIILPSLAI